MKLDVVFTPAGLTSQEVQGRTVFVIDILRATTTMCAALHHGAPALRIQNLKTRSCSRKRTWIDSARCSVW